jgi:hypothetical protein
MMASRLREHRADAPGVNMTGIEDWLVKKPFQMDDVFAAAAAILQERNRCHEAG